MLSRMKVLFARLILTVLLLATAEAGAIELRVCKIKEARTDYRTELLLLLMARTAGRGERVTLLPYEEGGWPTQERCLALLRERKIDVVPMTPTEPRLAEFAVIKTDIQNGMLGYRLLLINKKDQAMFAQVNSLQDLRRLTAGFGQQWSDLPMFSLNGLPVVTAVEGKNLLAMLNIGRFQYFHRGLNEVWRELESAPSLTELMIEPHLALAYHMPVYLMFNRQDTGLKQRFERGLALIEADGSFKALFQEKFGDLAERAQLSQRTVIDVDVPLPAGLPPRDTRFWLR